MKINFMVNDEKVSVNIATNDRLVDVLRNQLNLTGTKHGCGIGECGACTVIFNGNAVASCLILAIKAEGATIETVESKNPKLQIIQRAFIDNGAVQCGFCTPGMLMSTKALLDKNPKPTLEEIKTALEGNLCRCTGYQQIIEAVIDASKNY